jgi:DNA-binding IclR family transcriptional regulator
LERYTEKTVTDRQVLFEQIKEITATGFATDHGEFNEDLSSVAVPIRDYTRMLVGALTIVGPSHRLAGETIAKEIGPAILRAGGELSKRLGYAG